MRMMTLAALLALGVTVMTHAQSRKIDFSQGTTDQPPKGFEFGYAAGVG